MPYLNTIAQLISRNQVTEGGPSTYFHRFPWIKNSPVLVILVQAENEFSASSVNSPYMQAVIDTHRANGVVIRKNPPFSFAPAAEECRSNNSQRST